MRSPAVIALALAFVLGCGGTAGTGTTTAASSGSSTGPGGSGGSAGGSGGSTGGSGGVGGSAACPVCAAPESTGALGDAALDEVSGVVASLAHPGVFWVHNDSGDSARFFAIDATGARLATITVTGAQANDWEDLARGPCPAGTCLYLADIGDNLENRASYTVYRVPEPAAIADGSVAAEALTFSYPDGSHNAETLLVHPTTGAITIVTKVFLGESLIFELPLPATPGAPIVAKAAGTLEPPSGNAMYTGGDVHPSGKGVLLRTYEAVWYHPLAPGGTVAEALAGVPCPMPAPVEPQGEAVGWLADGMGYVTLSEGVGTSVNRLTCSGP